MDIQDSAGQSWDNNRSEVMSAFLTRMSDFFCPSDRELALRGQIKTGWSTVAARKKSQQSQVRLPPQEVKHIAEVVAQAEALQMAEELRIGVQMLKLQQLRKSRRGNGTSSCILCGYDFTHHRSRSPISLHVCRECSQAVCSRCKTEYKCHNGEILVLCRPCSDERELWKKSGAWLSNNLPVINVSEEELEKAQQQRQVQKVVPHRTNFMVPPSQLEDDDETEDDLSLSGSNYGGFPFLQGSAPSSRSPSPDLSFMSEANAAAAAWRSDKHPATELLPQSSVTLPHQLSNSQGMRKSGSYDLVAISRHRSRTIPSQERTTLIARKPAMSGDKKRDMEELRRRVIEKKRAGEQQRALAGTHPPTLSLDPLRMKRSRSNDLPVMSSHATVTSSPHPHVKVMVAPASPDTLRGDARSVSPLMESTMAPASTPKPPEPDTTTTTSPAGAPSIENGMPLSQQPDSTVEGKKRKPVPSPRRKQADSETPSSTTTPQPQQLPTQESVEFRRIVTRNVEGWKYGTLEREKKPSAAPRKRTASLDKEKSREYRSGTLEKKKRVAKTPEPQTSESSNAAPPSKKISLGSSKSRATTPPSFSTVVPHEVTREQESVPSQTSTVDSPHVKEAVKHPNPTLREIGKTVSVTSEGSVDSSREPESIPRADSGGSDDHKWQRKGAKRAGVRHKRSHPVNQGEVEEDEYSPRGRTRSGAVSGGGSAAAQRGHQNTTEEEEPHSSRSRTRSGAVSGGDAVVFRRSRNVKGSPRPARRAEPRQHSGGHFPEKDGIDFPEPLLPNEPYGLEEAELMHRSQVSKQRRAARTGGNLLVASDGEQD